jgi:hypothetical protein
LKKAVDGSFQAEQDRLCFVALKRTQLKRAVYANFDKAYLYYYARETAENLWA